MNLIASQPKKNYSHRYEKGTPQSRVLYLKRHYMLDILAYLIDGRNEHNCRVGVRKTTHSNG